MKREYLLVVLFMGVVGLVSYFMPGCTTEDSGDNGAAQDVSNTDGTSGNDVSMEDNGQGESVIHKSGEIIKSSQKWSGTHILEGHLYVESSVEIMPCSKILVNPDSKIIVLNSGSIKSIGTKDCPIIFTSSKPSPEKGDWRGIYIYNTSSSDNAFDYTIISYGGDNEYGLIWIEGDGSVKIDNTTFDNSSSYGIYIEEGAKIKSFNGNKFTNMELNPVILWANDIAMLSKIDTSGNTDNTILVNGGTVSKNAIWKNLSIPYKIKRNITINAPVEVEGGVIFLMDPLQKIKVLDGGSFKLAGKSDAQISIKSSKSSPASGDWYEIDIYKTSNNDNIWSYVNIMHGGGDDYGQVWVEDGAYLTLDNCKFSDGKTCDVYIEDGANVVNNNSTYTVCQQ